MTPVQSKNGLYDQALRLIRRRACEGVAIKEILSHLKISRATLERHFKRNLGHSAAHELFQIRLATARELLATTDLPVKRIALLVGYHSASNFCNMFLHQVGMSPGQFRARHGLIKSNADNAVAVKDAPSRHREESGSQKGNAFTKSRTKRLESKNGPALDRHVFANVTACAEINFTGDANMQLI